jgi:hypothetical protein
MTTYLRKTFNETYKPGSHKEKISIVASGRAPARRRGAAIGRY